MSKALRVPVVVAELGRPETPEETAARQAQNTRNHRARSTVNNLVLSLIATLGAVIVMVLIVPRAEAPLERSVDFAAVAAHAQPGFPQTLAVPALPEGWHSNAATTRTGDNEGVSSWHVGFITPQKQFIGLTQGFNANQHWIATQLAHSVANGTVVIDGVPWTTYDNRAGGRAVGNVKYALAAEADGSTYVLFGTADASEFHTLASALTLQHIGQHAEATQ